MDRTWWHKRARRGKQGTVTVELALTLPLLLLLLFAIAEVGFVILDSLALGEAARETARGAALGKSTAELRSLANAALPESMRLTDEQIALEKRSQSGGVWGSWTALGDTTAGGITRNDAATGDQVRVRLTYGHPTLTGWVFSRLDPDGTVTLTASTVMLRE